MENYYQEFEEEDQVEELPELEYDYGVEDESVFPEIRELLSGEPTKQKWLRLLEICVRGNKEDGYYAHGGEVVHGYIDVHLASWPAKIMVLPNDMQIVLEYERPLGALSWVKVFRGNLEIDSARMKKSLNFLRNLERFYLVCNNKVDVLDLSSVRNLKFIEIAFCNGLRDMWGLYSDCLESFYFSGNGEGWRLDDLVSNCPRLRSLTLEYDYLGDVRVLEKISGLESLTFFEAGNLKSFEELEGLMGLQDLYVNGGSLRSMKGLASMKNLQKLSLVDCGD